MGSSNPCCYRRKDDTLNDSKTKIPLNQEDRKRFMLGDRKIDKVTLDNSFRNDDSLKADPDLSSSTPNLQPCQKSGLFHNYYFFFENLEIFYKQCDDFGLSFKPKLIVKVEGLNEYEIQLISDEKGLDTSFNAPQRTDSSMINNSTILNKNCSNSNYRFNHIFQLKSEDFTQEGKDIVNIDFNSIFVTVLVVNERNMDLNGKCVLIGEIKIPLYLLSNHEILEGRIPLWTKYSKIIGFLDTRIGVISYASGSLPNSIHFEEFSENIVQSKTIFPDYPVIPYEYLADTLKIAFLRITDENISKQKDYSDIIIKLQKGNELEDHEQLTNLFLFAISNNDQVIIYSIIEFLIKKISLDHEICVNRTLTKDEEFVKNLFVEMEKNGNAFFKTLPDLIQKNLNYSLLLIYFTFIYKLVVFLRKLELDYDFYLKVSNFEMIFTFLIDFFNFTNKIFTDQDLNDKYYNIGKEINLWLLNCLNLMILPNFPYSKQQITNKEFLSKLYTDAYSYCLKVMAKPNDIVASFSYLREESEISSLTVRIFRKSIQMIMDYKNKLLAKNQRNKSICTNLKITLVLDENYRFFVEMIQFSLSNLKHYPEIYLNILMILNELSSDTLNKKLLFNLIRSISIKNLLNSFNNYRGKLKYISKQINYQFYTLFHNISTLLDIQSLDKEEFELNEEEINLLTDEMKTLFKMRINNKNKIEKSPKLDNFLSLLSLDLQEILSKIAFNLLKNPFTSKSICDNKCYFILYLLDFINNDKKEAIISLLKKTKNKAAKEEIALMYIKTTTNHLSCFEGMLKSPESRQYLLEMIGLSQTNSNQITIKILELLELFEVNFKSVDQSKLKGVSGKFIESLNAIK